MGNQKTLCPEGAQLAGTFYKKYRIAVFRYLFKNVGNRAMAEDITSSVFMKVTEAIMKGKYKERNSPKSWIMSIAHNEMVNHFRFMKKFYQYKNLQEELDLRNKDLNPIQLLERLESEDGVSSLIETLPEKERRVFELRSDFNMPFVEIAKLLGVPNNSTLRVCYSRAKSLIKKLVEEQGYILP